jgi:hypothetical protein
MSLLAISITLTITVSLVIGCCQIRAINNYPEFRLLKGIK